MQENDITKNKKNRFSENNARNEVQGDAGKRQHKKYKNKSSEGHARNEGKDIVNVK